MFRGIAVFAIAFLVSTSLLAWEGTTIQTFNVSGLGVFQIEAGISQGFRRAGGRCQPIGILGDTIPTTPFHLFWRIDRADATNDVTYNLEMLTTWGNGTFERETKSISMSAGTEWEWCYEKQIDRAARGINRFQLFINTALVAQWTVRQ
jgi:hypothetical protein